jgi:hypothetical protein
MALHGPRRARAGLDPAKAVRPQEAHTMTDDQVQAKRAKEVCRETDGEKKVARQSGVPGRPEFEMSFQFLRKKVTRVKVVYRYTPDWEALRLQNEVALPRRRILFSLTTGLTALQDEYRRFHCSVFPLCGRPMCHCPQVTQLYE